MTGEGGKNHRGLLCFKGRGWPNCRLSGMSAQESVGQRVKEEESPVTPAQRSKGKEEVSFLSNEDARLH